MKRAGSLLLLLLFCLSAAPASGAAVTLASKEAGYALALPGGWIASRDPALLQRLLPAGLFSPEATARLESTLQAAVFAPADGPPTRFLAVMHVDISLVAPEWDPGELDPAARGQLIRGIEDALVVGLAAAGAAPEPAARTDDGIGIGTRLPLSPGTFAYTILQVRLTRRHLICLYAARLSTDPEADRRDLETLLSLLTIASSSKTVIIEAP